MAASPACEVQLWARVQSPDGATCLLPRIGVTFHQHSLLSRMQPPGAVPGAGTLKGASDLGSGIQRPAGCSSQLLPGLVHGQRAMAGACHPRRLLCRLLGWQVAESALQLLCQSPPCLQGCRMRKYLGVGIQGLLRWAPCAGHHCTAADQSSSCRTYVFSSRFTSTAPPTVLVRKPVPPWEPPQHCVHATLRPAMAASASVAQAAAAPTPERALPSGSGSRSRPSPGSEQHVCTPQEGSSALGSSPAPMSCAELAMSAWAAAGLQWRASMAITLDMPVLTTMVVV